jgi:hypothetical protein
MPTTICFSGLGGDSIVVEETSEQLSQVLSTRQGAPLRLTRDGCHDGVYVNPDRIACWYPSAGGAVERPVVARRFRGPI